MPRFAATILIVYSLIVSVISTPVQAQPHVSSVEKGVAELPKMLPSAALTDPATRTERKKPNLRKVFDDETRKFNADTAKFDAVKTELDKARQAQKKGWTKKQTMFMVIFAAGVAVLVWLLIKYGKECIETNYADCTPTVDEGCYCERYAEDGDKNRGLSIRK